jgi:transposase-like protein
MSRRQVELEVKVNAVRESLRLVNVAAVARKHGVTPRVLYQWFHKLWEGLPQLMANAKPGPKAQVKPASSPPF